MSVLVNTTTPLDAATYDQMISALGATLKSAPGFRSHAAYPGPEGWLVTEIWDSAADHAAFFDAYVRNNLPPGVAPKVIEVHNAVMA